MAEAADWTREALSRALGESSLFSGLARSQLDRLARIGEVVTHPRGAVIFREGDPGTHVYVVLSGAVRISRQMPGMGEEALAILPAGAAFGELSLLGDGPRSADAIAHERCDLYRVATTDLEDLLFVDRALASEVLWKLVRMLADRLRQTNDKMVFLTASAMFGEQAREGVPGQRG